MAKSAAEKKAYSKEYYREYTKKGLKKGRKKGKKKSTSTSTLLGLSTSGLSTEGKMQAALIKEDFKKKMNEALSKAKTDNERKQIRLDYSKKALDAIEKLKSDPKNVQAKATKAKSAKAPKTKSAKEPKASKEKSTGDKVSGKTTKTAETTKSSVTPGITEVAISRDSMDALRNAVNNLRSKLTTLSDEDKKVLRNQITDIIDALKKKLAGVANE